MWWRLYPLAIALGLGASFAIAAFVSVLALLLLFPGEADLSPASIAADSGFQIAALVASILSSFVAGWVAARFSLGEELLNALATGAILVAFGVAGYVRPEVDALPGWVELLSLGLALPLAVTGGLLYRGR